MRNILIITSIIFICNSCFIHKGQRIDGQCRPKNPNFKLVKTPFKETDKIVFNKIYTYKNVYKTGIGFYRDGRLICFNAEDGFILEEKNVRDKNWNNAIAVGYWRFNDDKISIEFFVCQDGGWYNKKQGEIKGDTIVFYKNLYDFRGKEVREERYVLSDMRF
ncbi:MAG: hypothetical protein LBE34_02395 [Flavobacteriaceae bacterium]|nr:hypothetical protein [Flavobacteriaceae bacterium]